MNRLALNLALPFFELPQLTYDPPFDPAYFDRLQPAPRDYQFDLLDRVVAAIAAGYTRILVQLSTGGGKTHLAKALLGSTDEAQFIVHRKELIEQTSKAFWASHIAHGFVAANKPMGDRGILLCGIATLVKRLHLVRTPRIVIFDEAHHLGAATWAAVLASYPADTIIIGLTATPERLDGRGLGEHFQIMLCGPTTADLIGMGALSDYDYYAPSLPDMTGVRTDQQAEEVMDTPTLIGDMVEHYLRLAKGQPGIVFAHSREHSRHLVAEFRANGVRAAHLGGDLDTAERERIDAAFRARDYDIVTSVQLIGEGYDVPGVVYCGLGRRTMSLSWYLQMVGRALRPPDRAIICDHAGNAFVHGLPDDDRAWSLLGRAARQASDGVNDDAEPVRQCKVCFQISRSTVKVCPCGEEFPVQVRELKQKAGELEKLERAAIREREKEEREARKQREAEERARAARQRKREERECAGFDDFVRLAEQRGIENAKGWARMKMQFRSSYGSRR